MADSTGGGGGASAPITMRATIYYLALESDYSTSDKDGLFRDAEGNILYKGSHEFKAKASIEGSAKLLDGRVLNYHSKINGEVLWIVSATEYGMGAVCPLVPMRSVAVDPDVIPLNIMIHIKETEGLVLPDGSKHDGFWLTVDVGSAIKGSRMDLFSGVGVKSMKALLSQGLGHMEQLTVRLIRPNVSCEGLR